ncbi:hypothetical protein BLD44_001035 [Mastigocladus laminosus UU774]|nr:hypothetical protein B4U84_10080 [Westiellopsis prolifica IICB1]TFI55955.1 hypothetical protein BLD44_001035 [Mastigocladus laminosus UU774]
MQLLKQENKRKSSILPLFAVGTFGLNIFALLILMFHSSMLQQLSQQLTPRSLVQLADGRAITADPTGNLERYPDTIRRFVGETMTLMLTWSPQQSPEIIWEISSELLTNDLKQKFQSEVINPNTVNQFANRGAESVFIIQRISQPVKIANGKWRVELQGNQLIFNNSDRLGKAIAFNKQILIQAIDNQKATLPDLPLSWHIAAYRIGEARLEIYNICDIKEKNCS